MAIRLSLAWRGQASESQAQRYAVDVAFPAHVSFFVARRNDRGGSPAARAARSAERAAPARRAAARSRARARCSIDIAAVVYSLAPPRSGHFQLLYLRCLISLYRFFLAVQYLAMNRGGPPGAALLLQKGQQGVVPQGERADNDGGSRPAPADELLASVRLRFCARCGGSDTHYSFPVLPPFFPSNLLSQSAAACSARAPAAA